MNVDETARKHETDDEFQTKTNVNPSEKDPIINLKVIGEWKSEEDVEREKRNRRRQRYIYFSKVFPHDANGFYSQKTLERMFEIYHSPDSDDADRWAIESLIVENFERYIAARSREFSYGCVMNEHDIDDLMDILREYVLKRWQKYDSKHGVVFLGFLKFGCFGKARTFVRKKLRDESRYAVSIDDDSISVDEIVADHKVNVEATVQDKILVSDINDSLNELEMFVASKRADGYSVESIADAVVAAGLREKYNAGQVSKLLKSIRERFDD